MINQAVIVIRRAIVWKKFLHHFWQKTFSAESITVFDPVGFFGSIGSKFRSMLGPNLTPTGRENVPGTVLRLEPFTVYDRFGCERSLFDGGRDDEER